MREQDYDNVNVRTNGHTDRWNVVDTLWQVIRGNLASIDSTQWFQHVVDNNHNLEDTDGQSSTFGGLTQDDIGAFVAYVIGNFRPTISNTTLVFDSTGGITGFTTGQNSAGNNIRNIRVTCDVNALRDDVDFATQLGFVIVTNAYPIS